MTKGIRTTRPSIRERPGDALAGALRSLAAVVAASMLVHCGVADAQKPLPATSANAPPGSHSGTEPAPTEAKRAAPVGSEAGSTSSGELADAGAADASAPAPKAELPRGGRELFPTHRLVGFCGTPGAPALGRLAGNLKAKAKTIEDYANKHANGRTPLPVFELIAVVVQGVPGKDGKWRRRVPESVVDDYLKAARAARALLLLNIQPGHSDFLTEAKAYEKYLHEPDVGLALDPEWAMKGKQKPGVYYGQTTGTVINEVSEWLSGIVKARDLPEKALVFHQVNGYVVKDEEALVAQSGVVLIKSVDGLGPQGAKIKTYNFLVKNMPSMIRPGFKLFFDEDTANGWRLMAPKQVMALAPEPEYVMYE